MTENHRFNNKTKIAESNFQHDEYKLSRSRDVMLLFFSDPRSTYILHLDSLWENRKCCSYHNCMMLL